MKNLIKNYIDLLSIEKLEQFGIKNNINLSKPELELVFNLIKNDWEDILIDDSKYLEYLKTNINEQEFLKIKELYLYYKNRYKGYLF